MMFWPSASSSPATVSTLLTANFISVDFPEFGGPAKKVDEIEDGHVVAISPGAAGAVKA